MASNIGKQPINIVDGVTIQIDGRRVTATGPKGSLDMKLPQGISIVIDNNVATIKKDYEAKMLEKFYGLSRALLANMVIGVTSGFEKKLELSGVGYRAKAEGSELVLNVGYAVPVKIQAPEGVTFQVADNVITVAGIDKALIGDVASKIRAVRPPDPYKAKGIKYEGEKVRRKVGKAAKAVGSK